MPTPRASAAVPPGELSVALLTDPDLARLHADFLGDPKTTDVITFAGQPALGLAGEICVSVDTAAAYARKHRRRFAEELTLYVVHGWLHLAGYDDLMPVKKRAMRRAERRALALLRSRRVRRRSSCDRRVATSPDLARLVRYVRIPFRLPAQRLLHRPAAARAACRHVDGVFLALRNHRRRLPADLLSLPAESVRDRAC